LPLKAEWPEMTRAIRNNLDFDFGLEAEAGLEIDGSRTKGVRCLTKI